MQPRNKILAVDDSPTNIAVMKEMLSGQYILKTAASGHEALTIAEEFKPDITLLDIMMPGIDGYQVCRRIKADPELRHTKIIMVSAKAMVSERLEGYEAGADDYITKPFDEDELLAKIRVYLRLRSVEEVDKAKNGVLSHLGHEMGSQLHGILLPITILMSDDNIVAIERKMLSEMVYRNVKRLQKMLEDIARSKDLPNAKPGESDTEADAAEQQEDIA